MKVGLIVFLSVFLSSTGFAQTAAEKIAVAYCECTKTHDIAPYVKIFREGDKNVMDKNYEQIEELRGVLKKCAKANVVLTPEENKKVAEEEITAALNKACPDLNYFLEQYQKMMYARIKEMEE